MKALRICTCASILEGALFLPLVIVSGCGGTTKQSSPPPPNSPVMIETQPASATIPLGSTGTFTLLVGGTPPFTYQWNKNGEAVTGATSATYTTPLIESSDNGTQYTVTVSNSVNSI